jgi:hypothetical protein
LVIEWTTFDFGVCEWRLPDFSCRMRVPIRERLSNSTETFVVGSSAESPPAGTQ